MNRDIEGLERRAFVHWMRTGRLLPDGEPTPQWKYNPWHDVRNGQFTSGQSGFASRISAGGGSFGGAGSETTFELPDPTAKRPAKSASTRPPKSHPKTVVAAAVTVAAHRGDNGRRILHVRNGYRFETDSLHRTRYTDAHLKLGRASARSRLAQARAGGSDRLSGDDGGHFIAHRFNGPSDSFNHFAQSARFSRGTYRALEDEWARALRAGEAVHVHITPTYLGASQRPSSLQVEWTIKGHTKIKHFPN